MEFEWDEAKARTNQSKHSVAFDDAATIFGDVLSWTYPDAENSRVEERWITIGRSDRGRILVVSHTERGNHIRLISARRATKKERSFYEKRR